MRQELVQRRVEEPDRGGEAVQFREHADKIRPLIGKQLGQRRGPVVSFLRQNHFAHRVDPVAFEEHVLGAAKADARGAERDRVGGLLGCIGVGADPQSRGLTAPVHELGEIPVGLAVLGLE